MKDRGFAKRVLEARSQYEVAEIMRGVEGGIATVNNLERLLLQLKDVADLKVRHLKRLREMVKDQAIFWKIVNGLNVYEAMGLE